MIGKFDNPEHAIKFSYAMESRDIVRISSYFSSLRGGSVKNSIADDPWSMHAQAAMILAMIDRIVGGPQAVAVRAHYTIPSTGILEYRKATDCVLLTEHLLGLRAMPRFFVLDTVRGWVGYRRTQTDIYWARDSKVSERTIREWRGGRVNRGWDGIIQILDSLEAGAISAMHGPMEAAGLI